MAGNWLQLVLLSSTTTSMSSAQAYLQRRVASSYEARSLVGIYVGRGEARMGRGHRHMEAEHTGARSETTRALPPT